ncbi:unnamed protein product [Mytilus coruscus]|uniref:Apple domain-containing protein n=1 Tax=Mytilus coruscus TaxID=42192 RepID=A0A6J8DDR8_MYTCO|nr:unnamed protein product [Mytilus coruscus]
MDINNVLLSLLFVRLVNGRVVSGWTSKTSTIYQNFNGKSEKVAYHSMPNAAQKRRFWIGWFNGILRVGCFTGIVSQNVIMEYVIPCPFSILYVGVTSINSASWWPYEGVEYHEDTSCKVTHCDHCIRYTLRTKCPAFVMKMSVKVNSEDDCLSQCYKDDECEAFDYDRIAHVCRLFTDEVDPEGEIISPIFRRLP